MRYVEIDTLPRIKEKRNYNKIDWSNSMNSTVNFIYDNISGNLQIIDYNKKNHKLSVKYNSSIFNIDASHLLRCQLGSILGIYLKDFRFKVGDVITDNHRNIKILNTKKIRDYSKNYLRKGYTYQCLIDGYVGNVYENDLMRGAGCPICANKKIMIGINDMWTTNPELAKLLADPKDGYRYTQSSTKEIYFECPECGNIIKHRKICDIYHYIEFMKLNAAQLCKASMMLKERLKIRRHIKDELKRILYVESSNKESIKNGDLRRAFDGLEHRKYEPRVLKELFNV